MDEKPTLDMGPWLNEKMKEYSPEDDFIGMVNDCYNEKADTSALLPRGKMAIVWAYNRIAKLEKVLRTITESACGEQLRSMCEAALRELEGK